MFSAGNGGFSGDSCAFNGYVNSIYTIAISTVNWDGSIPVFAEQCAGIMAVTYGEDMFNFGKMSPPPVVSFCKRGQPLSIQFTRLTSLDSYFEMHV